MKRFLLAVAVAVSAALLAGPVAAQEKEKKSDVILKVDDKTGKAKVGQTIEIPIPNPPAKTDDIKVTIEGEAIDKTVAKRLKVLKEGGDQVGGAGAVVLKAKAAGTSKVRIEYKDQKREYQIEVTN